MIGTSQVPQATQTMISRCLACVCRTAHDRRRTRTDDYPSRVVRIINPYVGGSTTDVWRAHLRLACRAGSGSNS
jgi:hypothetical protein